jgi:hypothetical protein
MFLLLALMSLGAQADTGCEINYSGLPKEALQQLKVDCENARLKAIQAAKDVGNVPDVSTLTPERITSWAQVAAGFADAIGLAANKLGVSVNEFIKTPAGMITVGVILWKVAGTAIIKICFLLLVIAGTKSILRAMWASGTYQETRNFLWYERTVSRRKYQEWRSATDNLIQVTMFVLLLSTIVSITTVVSLV